MVKGKNHGGGDGKRIEGEQICTVWGQICIARGESDQEKTMMQRIADAKTRKGVILEREDAATRLQASIARPC